MAGSPFLTVQVGGVGFACLGFVSLATSVQVGEFGWGWRPFLTVHVGGVCPSGVCLSGNQCPGGWSLGGVGGPS